MLNGAVAVLILIAAFTGAGLGPEGAASTTLVSVFALIYVIAFGVFTLGHDGKGLGWYCLFATIVFLWYGQYFLGVGAMELGMFNIAWAMEGFSPTEFFSVDFGLRLLRWPKKASAAQSP